LEGREVGSRASSGKPSRIFAKKKGGGPWARSPGPAAFFRGGRFGTHLRAGGGKTPWPLVRGVGGREESSGDFGGGGRFPGKLGAGGGAGTSETCWWPLGQEEAQGGTNRNFRFLREKTCSVRGPLKFSRAQNFLESVEKGDWGIRKKKLNDEKKNTIARARGDAKAIVTDFTALSPPPVHHKKDVFSVKGFLSFRPVGT